MIGKTLGKYRIVEQIGRGGMASVYKAYQPGLDRYVAIKTMHAFLSSEEGFVERFRREAQSVARLRHPNIVQMHDFDVDGDVYYMVMEFLTGPSLKNHLAELETRGEWLSLEQAVHIVRDVGEALDYAHSRDMVHRDVKPANIMLTDDGGAILTDFGIVKMLGLTTQLTVTGAMVGTPAYMSPEQGKGEAGDDRADIYSLGIVLYQLVTGRLPYSADTPMAIVLQHLTAPLPIPRTLNPDLPEGIQRIILKALAKDPDDRYQTVREMLNQLDQAMQGLPIPPVDPSITTANQQIVGEPTLTGPELSTSAPALRRERAAPAVPPSRRFPWWLFGLAALALILAFVGGFALLGGGSEPTPTSEPTKVAVATLTLTFTPTPTGTPTPSNTPDLAATERAATVDAFFLTANADTATPTPTSTPTYTPTPSSTPTPTNTPTPTSTPDLTATANAACVFDAALERHVTIRPGQYFAPGTAFEKTWRLSNTGDCAWPPGTVLAFVSGNQMEAEDEVEVELAAPGETADVTVALRAPRANGYYAAAWQLHDPDGEPFGEEIAVEINVGPTPTPRATNTPRPTDTPLATDTPAGPVQMSVPSIAGGSCWIDPNTGRWGGRLVWSAWGGTGEYEFYIGVISPEFRLDGPSYDFDSQVNHGWPTQTFIVVSGGQEHRVYRGVNPSECGY